MGKGVSGGVVKNGGIRVLRSLTEKPKHQQTKYLIHFNGNSNCVGQKEKRGEGVDKKRSLYDG